MLWMLVHFSRQSSVVRRCGLIPPVTHGNPRLALGGRPDGGSGFTLVRGQ